MLAIRDRLDDVAVRAVVEPVDAGAVATDEADKLTPRALPPAPPRDAGRPLIRPERLGSREHVRRSRTRSSNGTSAGAWHAAREQVAVTIRRAAGAHVRDVSLGNTIPREDIAHDERVACGHRVDRHGLALEIREAADRGRRRDRREPAVVAEEREEVGLSGIFASPLPFLVSDQVVDAGERDVVATVEERG